MPWSKSSVLARLAIEYRNTPWGCQSRPARSLLGPQFMHHENAPFSQRGASFSINAVPPRRAPQNMEFSTGLLGLNCFTSGNPLKLFDIIGIVVVAFWLGLAGFYIYQNQSSPSADAYQRSDQFVMREGSSWYVLGRNDQDAGFVHQTRTALTDGWLLEHDTFMVVTIGEVTQLIESSVKTRLGVDGFISQFTTEVTTSGGVFRATGRVEDLSLHLTTSQAEETKTQDIALDAPIRMSSNALNTLLATEEFVPGESYGGRFFDPYKAEILDVQMRYIEHKPLEVYDETFEADHFRKRVGSRELDFYVDKNAELLIRAFPVRTTSARIPAVLGKTRSASIRRQIEAQSPEKSDTNPDAPKANSLGLNVARQILAGQYSDEVLALSQASASKASDSADENPSQHDSTDADKAGSTDDGPAPDNAEPTQSN